MIGFSMLQTGHPLLRAALPFIFFEWPPYQLFLRGLGFANIEIKEKAQVIGPLYKDILCRLSEGW